MANDAINISIPVKFEVKTPPCGMTDYDPKALTVDQQRELNVFKLKLRKENVVYLASHPEIRGVVSWIVRKTLIKRPRNLVEFVAKLFTQDERFIREEINKILSQPEFENVHIPFTEYEDWDY